MRTSIWKRAADFLLDQKAHKLRLGIFLCLAAVAVFGITNVLKYNGIAMTHKQKVLECPYTVHTHTQACYEIVEGEKVLTCGRADYVIHTHNDDCYDGDGMLVCSLPEVEEHKHTEACYTDEQVLVCTQTESMGHQHGAECYTTEQGGLTCQIPEHQHTEECYDEAGEAICGQSEHLHSEACYETTSTLTCGQEAGAGGHTHTAECYETRRVLSCGKLEKHTHDEKTCYDKDKNLICQKTVLEEHVHSDECFRVVELTPEEVAALNSPIFFTPDESDEEVPEEPAGSEEEPIQEDSAAEEGSSVDESDVLEPNLKKVFQSELLTVTAVYYEEANIPEEAELDVQLILDEVQYQARLEEAAEWMQAEDTAWLYDIGFFVDGEEIEPEDTVHITMEIHFDALPDRAPVSVVHFAKMGPELLEASELAQTESGSFVTEFEVNEFSEFLLIVGEPSEEPGEAEQKDAEQVSYKLSDSFEFETDKFQLTLHVDGIATAEKPEGDSVDETVPEESALEENATPADEPAETTEDDAGVQPAEDAEDAQTPAEAEEPRNEPAEEQTVFTTEDDGQAPENAEDPEALEKPEPQELTAEDVESELELLAEDDEIYAAFAEAAKIAQDEDADEDGESKLLNLSVMQFKLSYDEMPLDLTGCLLTAEVTPKETVLEGLEVPEDAEVEPAVSVSLMQMQGGDDEETPGDVVTLDSGTLTAVQPMMLSAELDGDVMALNLVAENLNPKYHVQYYAKLDEPKKTDVTTRAGVKTGGSDTSLPIISTAGKKLPKQGEATQVMYYTLKNGSIQTEPKLTQIYNITDSYSYLERPELKYIKLLPNGDDKHYTLSEIWVQEKGGDPDSTVEEEWTVYKGTEETKVEDLVTMSNTTNPDNEENHITITEDMVIRLVYEPQSDTEPFQVMFHDYDISGTGENGEVTFKKDGKDCHYTAQNGINDPSNYPEGSAKGQRVAFGNKNASELGSNYGNMASTDGFATCAYGLVASQLGPNGTPVFNYPAADMFGPSTTPKGKTTYSDRYSLNFNRVGDTYTLSSVTDKEAGCETASNLEQFSVIEKAYNTTDLMYKNVFWPLDKVTGADGLNGDVQNPFYFYNGQSYGTDNNGPAHNFYFGMQYTVTFEFDEHYVGPLNYTFVGDDDMWVYLDGELIADIGGVHSCRCGEYVDLWDHLDQGDAGQHTLSVFYTERGGSGSTCYMQFTLPSVVSLAPGAVRGSLELSKEVEGPAEGNEEYQFTVSLEKASEAYQYSITRKNGGTETGSIQGGQTNSFTLSAGDHLKIENLPIGAKYTITEQIGAGYMATATVNGKERTVTNGTITGTVTPSHGEVVYTNHYYYKLPESGGAGTTMFAFGGIAMIAICLMYGYSMRRRRGRKAN